MKTGLVIVFSFWFGLSYLHPARSVPMTVEMRQQDPRLEKRVTLIAPHIFIGELLEDLSKQSGVMLTNGDDDESGDPQVMITVRNAPLGDVLAALCSLVSYQKAEWEWSRSGSAGNFTYQLTQPPTARTLAARLRAQVQKEFEDQTHEMLNALKMSPNELNAAAKDNPLLQSMADGKDNRVKPGFQIMADSLAPDMLEAVLQGEQSVQIPISQLSPAAQAFANSQWQWELAHGAKTQKMDGTWVPMAAPQNAVIEVQRFGSNIAPTLVLDIGFGSGGYSGGAWMEKAWEKKVSDLWMLPGDITDNFQMAFVPRDKTRVRVASESQGFTELGAKMDALAADAPLNLIARLPHDENFGSSEARNQPYSKSVAAFLKSAEDEMPHLRYKWHDNILLLTYPAWFVDETPDTIVPWTFVKHLRAQEMAEGGYLSLADFEEAAQKLNVGQLKTLGERVPVLKSVAVCHDFLLQMARSPSLAARMTSADGVPAGDVVDALKSFLPIDQPYQDGTMRRVRITTGFNMDIAPNQMDISIQAIDVKSKEITGMEIIYNSNEMQWQNSTPANP